MKNESRTLSGIMTRTCELPTIKKLEIDDLDDPFGLMRICGILIAAALSCIVFV